jgi:hypothetical protein
MKQSQGEMSYAIHSIFPENLMFRTYKHAELEVPSIFGADFQMWHFIELGIHRPWFYAGTRDSLDEDALVTMKMIPNVQVLQCLLDEHTDDQIQSLQLISPGHVNGTDGWVMETLMSLSVLSDRTGRSSGYRYIVEGGKAYDVIDLNCSASEFKIKEVVFARA